MAACCHLAGNCTLHTRNGGRALDGLTQTAALKGVQEQLAFGRARCAARNQKQSQVSQHVEDVEGLHAPLWHSHM